MRKMCRLIGNKHHSFIQLILTLYLRERESSASSASDGDEGARETGRDGGMFGLFWLRPPVDRMGDGRESGLAAWYTQLLSCSFLFLCCYCDGAL